VNVKNTFNINETNNLIIAATVWVGRKLGLKKATGKKATNSVPWWKRRIEVNITELQKNINMLTRYKNGEIKSKKKIEKLNERYRIDQKGLSTVLKG